MDALRDSSVRLIAHAVMNRVCFGSLADSEQPASLADAYDRQALLERELGYEGAGWKVAGCHPQGLLASPTGRPAFGRLWAQRCHASGARLSLPKMGPVTIGVELAVRIERDAFPARERFDASMVDGVFVAFEVLRSRFLDVRSLGHFGLVADNLGLDAFVLGGRLPRSWDDASRHEDAWLMRNGSVVCGLVPDTCRTHVFHALQQFWSHAAERRLEVPAGSLIATGARTVPVETRKRGLYEGRIGDAAVAMVID